MKTSDVFPSRFLRGDDLPKGAETVVTISKVTMETVHAKDGDEQRPVLHARELAKPVILNKSMWLTAARLLGDESDDWLGQQVALVRVRTFAFGQNWDVIRVAPALPKRPRAEGKGLRAEGRGTRDKGEVARSGWRAAPVHFGKCAGQALGSLAVDRLKWFQEHWRPLDGSPENMRLRQALDESMLESGGPAHEGELIP